MPGPARHTDADRYSDSTPDPGTHSNPVCGAGRFAPAVPDCDTDTAAYRNPHADGNAAPHGDTAPYCHSDAAPDGNPHADAVKN